MPGQRIGLLGGSFNPAHGAHLEISRTALTRLGLDEVWWLVSPQNPLKPARGMAPLESRLAGARDVADHPRIRVTALESALGTLYSADTVRALTTRFPKVRFVWLIGADNLGQIPRWKDWREIFAHVPVAVFARPNYSSRALSGKAAQSFARARIRESRATRLADTPPPAWVFIHGRLNPSSSTAIRGGAGDRTCLETPPGRAPWS